MVLQLKTLLHVSAPEKSMTLNSVQNLEASSKHLATHLMLPQKNYIEQMLRKNVVRMLNFTLL